VKNPLFVFEVTPKCNLSCRYCYNIWKTQDYLAGGELPLSGIELLADSISAAHPVSITLTGGEPLLRKDLCGIVHAFSDRGIRVGIATNGLLLDQETAELLKKAGVEWVEVSIPSLHPDRYEDLCGIVGPAAVKGAMLAVKSVGIRLTVSHIITSVNCDEAGVIVDLAYAFSADAVALNRFVPGGTGLSNQHLLPTLNQLDSSLKKASERSLRSPGITVFTAIPVEDCILKHADYPGIKFGSCICGVGKWAINPAGDLRICEQSPHSIGNLLESPFAELFESQFIADFRDFNCRSTCPACASFSSCGGGCRFLRVIPGS